MTPEDFWTPFEADVSSFGKLVEVIGGIFDRKEDQVFAWRGQGDASWALNSSLYRLACPPSVQQPPDEEALYECEGEILTKLHRWGLHTGPTGRLSILNQLALLQHYGSPTRLIDVTFNPWIATWFAVVGRQHASADGRLFAIDVTDRLINENDDLRGWEDDSRRPWRPKTDKDSDADVIDTHLWSTRAFAWRPPHFDRRIAAQNGGFVFGGVPRSTDSRGKRLQWPKGKGKGTWRLFEVRSATSVALRPHRINSGPGRPPVNPVYTIRIKAAAKWAGAQIRS